MSFRKPMLVTLMLALGFGLWSGCLLWCKSAALDMKAVEVWRKQEATFKEALRGHQTNDKFEQACLFFEQTTGLKVHVNYFTFGALPTSETAQDLARIQAWYKSNKYRLYWDEATHTVKVRASKL
jgi:hypothetical protein